jgi:ABC-2 type transport system permease protein
MKKIFAIAIKDTLVRFASPSEWIFFLLLPVIFTVILGNATGVADSRVRLPIVDEAHTTLSEQLIAELQDSSAVHVELQDRSTAVNDFNNRRNSAVLILPAGADLQNGSQMTTTIQLMQQPNNLDALIASQAVQAAAARVSSLAQTAALSLASAEKIRPFADEAARQAYYDAAFTQAQSKLAAAPNRLDVVQGITADTVEYDPNANSSAGQLITWVFIPLIGLSATFAYERQKGTLRRLMTTPTSRSTFLIGTITGQVLTALVQMLLLIGVGILIMHVNWGRSPAALALMLVSSALAAAALGTMLGTFVKTEGQAGGLSTMLGMVMALLGGCWYPLELFPKVVGQIVHVLPTTWAMQGLLDIVLRGAGVMQVLLEAAVLLGFAVLFFVIGVRRFRYE